MSTAPVISGLETSADDVFRDIIFKDKTALSDKMQIKTGMITIKWGEIGVNGIGSLNSFHVSGKSWPINYWSPLNQKHYLTDSSGQSFLITSNTVDTLVVVGTPLSGSYTISPKAYSYEVKLQYLDESGVLVSNSEVFYEVTSNESVVPPIYSISGLIFGRTYRISIASKGSPNKNSRSEFSDPRDITVGTTGYSQLVMSPISLVEKDYGILVEWTPVEHAKGYELVWTTDGTPPDFDAIDQNMAKTYSLQHPIVADVDQLVRVSVRCYDRTGLISSNVEEDSMMSGAQSARAITSILSGIIVNKDNSSTTQDLRTLTKFSLPEKSKISKIQLYCQSLANGPQKIRVFVDGKESTAVNLIVSTIGYSEQVVSLSVLAESTIVIDCWDSVWNTTPPSTYPSIYGQLSIRYDKDTSLSSSGSSGIASAA